MKRAFGPFFISWAGARDVAALNAEGLACAGMAWWDAEGARRTFWRLW